MSKKTIIGIDEVGRGPIAGPTCVAAFQIFGSKLKIKNSKLPLRDSKKLTELQREAWFKEIKILQKEGKCDFATTLISAKIIDQIGISKAIQKALDKSLCKLKANNSHPVLLDGSLKAPKEFINQKTIIKGDEKIPAISFASIVAKVTRDRLMKRLAKKYPVYDFEVHKGYGTRAHYQKLKKHGPSVIHRHSFLKNLAI